jgi:hypothetical protein
MPIRRLVVTAILFGPLCLLAQVASPVPDPYSGSPPASPSRMTGQSRHHAAPRKDHPPRPTAKAPGPNGGIASQNKSGLAPPLQAESEPKASDGDTLGGLTFSRLSVRELEPGSLPIAGPSTSTPCSRHPCKASCPGGQLGKDGLCISRQPLPQCPTGQAPADSQLMVSGPDACMKLSDLRITDCGPVAQMLDEAEVRVHLSAAIQQAACSHKAASQECAERKSQHKDAVTRYKRLQVEHDRCLLE